MFSTRSFSYWTASSWFWIVGSRSRQDSGRLSLSDWSIPWCLSVLFLGSLAYPGRVHGQVGPEAAVAPPVKIYLIGNSLTWDSLPGLLDGDVQWHVDCGKNLQYIFDNPASPCVKTSTPWNEALKAKQYDTLCVQPFFGTTLEQDLQVISAWMALQPTAGLVIHTGWNRADNFEKDYHANAEVNLMIHSPAYFQALQTQLQAKHPDRSIRISAALDVLDHIWHDIEQGKAPFQSFPELYRDEIHMTTQAGRYLMHNVLRQSMQQPQSDQGFQLEATQKVYLDQRLRDLAATQPTP